MSTKSNRDQAFQYAAIIQEKLSELFEEEQITLLDLGDEKKATAFLHALANIVPCTIYKNLTSDECDMLGFNHITNRLVVQFSDKEK